MPRALFTKCDDLRYTDTYPGLTAWSSTSYDDSGWQLIQNGVGNIGSDAASPDGRDMPNWDGSPSLGLAQWNSVMTGEGEQAQVGTEASTNWFRFTVDLTAEDLSDGVYIWTSCDYAGTLYVNGNHIGFTDRHGFNVTSVCTVGTNIFGFEVIDYAYPPPESGYSYEAHEAAQDGLALDTFFWVHLQTGSELIEVTCAPDGPLSATETVVIGGPYGDYSPFATENPPGGVIQPGWKRGWRHGYKQNQATGYLGCDFITHPDYWDLAHAVTVSIDHEHCLALYYFMDGVLKAALLKRVDDALYDVARDFEFAIIDDSFGNYPNMVATLLSFDGEIATVAVGYLAGGNEQSPEGYAKRVAVLRVYLNGSRGVFELVAKSEPYDWENGGSEFYKMVRLSDTRFAVAEDNQTYFRETDENYVYDGAFWVDGSIDDMYALHVGVRAFEVVDDSITVGPSIWCAQDYSNLSIATVNENRVVIAGPDDFRIELKDKAGELAAAHGQEGRYWPGLFIRTCDIADDLTITENIESGVCVDANAVPPSGWEFTGLEMITDDTGVVLYHRGAQLAPSGWWRSAAATPYWEEGTPFSRLSTAFSGGEDGRTNWDYGNQNTALIDGYAAVPAAQVFRLDVDGGVSIPNGYLPHVLDASPTSYVPRDWWEGNDIMAGGGVAQYYDLFNGYSTVKVDDYVMVAWWTLDCARGARMLDGFWLATVLRLDEASPSGLTQHGYRHLGYMGSDSVFRNMMNFCHFPGTNWFCAVADPASYPVVDGPYSSVDGNTPPGTEDFPLRVWNEEEANDYGFYTPANWASHSGLYVDYDGVSMGSLSQDYWDETNVRDRLDKYGITPEGWFGEWNEDDKRTWESSTILRAELYEITPPPKTGEPGGHEMRIHRATYDTGHH